MKRAMLLRRPTLALALALFGCSSSDDANEDSGPKWAPGVVYPTERDPGERGLLDRRGLVHAHSVYSWDACDSAPRDENGAINQTCFEDFRRGLCQSQHDFVMLTDHSDAFASTEMVAALLYDATRGDTLLERDGRAVASAITCPNGERVLVLAGAEAGTMPVGLDRHVAESVSEREGVYGAKSEQAIAELKAAGAVALVPHTEKWTVDELATLPLDGFESYNLHANTVIGAGAAIGLIADLKTPEELPHPDLVLLPIVSEDPRYVVTWGSVLARGARRVTTLGTDCHQNTFEELLPDGERIDSYRRTMLAFSNHLLLAPDAGGSYGDRELKDALRGGRVYAVFEVLGYPRGFDYYAESAGVVHEMGAELALSSGVELKVVPPEVQDLNPNSEPPEIVSRILRATSDGWEVMSEGRALAFSVALPGAYRAEVRIRPRHLRGYLGSYTALAERDFVWIYANPIYVK